MCRHRQVLLLLRFQQRPSGRVPQPGHIAPGENLGGLGTWPSPVCKGRRVGSRPRRPRAHNSLEGSPGPAASWGCQGGSRGSAALFLPRTAEAPSEDRQDDCYRLPIARDDIYFLAYWEELARHEDTLLQVCAQPPRAAGTRGCSPQPQRAPATLACAAGPALATEASHPRQSSALAPCPGLSVLVLIWADETTEEPCSHHPHPRGSQRRGLRERLTSHGCRAALLLSRAGAGTGRFTRRQVWAPQGCPARHF